MCLCQRPKNATNMHAAHFAPSRLVGCDLSPFRNLARENKTRTRAPNSIISIDKVTKVEPRAGSACVYAKQ